MNYENFKIIERKNRKPNELVNYGLYLHKDKKAIINYFDSCADLVSCVEDNIRDGYFERYGRNNRDDNNSWVYGTDGYDNKQSTFNALTNGQVLAKHLDLVTKYKHELFTKYPQLANLRHTAITTKRKRTFNDNDGELDIDRYLCNDENIWSKKSVTRARGNICRFHFAQATAAGNDFASFINGMAWAVALTEIVETGGLSVELTFSYCVNGCLRGADTTGLIIKAKDASESFDVSRLMTFGLSGLLRRYAFDVWHNINISGYDVGFGCSISSLKEIPQILEFINADIVVANTAYRNEDNIQEIVNGVERLFKTDKAIYHG